jgi:hypothetical protein
MRSVPLGHLPLTNAVDGGWDVVPAGCTGWLGALGGWVHWVIEDEKGRQRLLFVGDDRAGAVKVVARAHQRLIFRTHPSHPAAAPCAARVLPGGAGGV